MTLLALWVATQPDLQKKSGVQDVMVTLQVPTVRLKAFMEHAIKIQLARSVSWFSDTKRVSSDIWSPLVSGHKCVGPQMRWCVFPGSRHSLY